ncbi:atrial natriuretic peptide receptor 3 isoform X1 [Acyrthosiphon pisum]|uniref:Receptor ligand binding region domain-containing protein n=1 Tax=Acyrthosiphon pisum TaxID=7029 RepID=A0A8R2JNS0_ACYPI|nr:atrial natriuretic peptide receptor 3 isoform X1 [Acyrthosiphon pisum]
MYSAYRVLCSYRFFVRYRQSVNTRTDERPPPPSTMIRGSIVAAVLSLPPPSLLLLSLSLSLSLPLISGGSTALRRPVEIRAAVILPAESKFITTLSKVMPVLDIAVRDLYAKGILRETDVTFKFMQKDDKCEDIEAMRSGFELIINGRVDLFLGPTCDYGVDLVARMIKFWNAPLLTTGGFTNDFSLDKRDPKSKYFLLVRTGTLDFQDIADVVLSVLNRYSWKNVLLIYDIDGYWKVSGKQSCGLMTKTLVEMFKGNASIRYDAFDLAKNPQNNLTENLRNEVGSKHTNVDGLIKISMVCWSSICSL